MARPRILTLILAGGKGSRMGVLTKVRAKPALPYAGVYRLIDFPLSNCVHSGLNDVWLIEQFQPHSLNDHIANGRPWDLDRTYGGLRIMQPYTGTQESGFAQGNADAIYRNINQLRHFGPDLVLVMSADHIYKLDYGEVIDSHLQNEADVTLVTTRMPVAEAHRFGVVEAGRDGRVSHFEYKPDSPRSDLVTTEIFVYTAPKLLEILDELAGQGSDDEPALQDFGHELLPRMVDDGRAYFYEFDGYWRDVGVIESYWQSHMDLLGPESPLHLDEPRWPILTHGFHRRPARIHRTAQIENSLIAPGCEIHGHVVDSVLAPGVVVEEGAEVHNTIVFHDSVIARGTRVAYTVVDGGAWIGPEARIGGVETQDGPGGRPIARIAVVGEGARIAERGVVSAGGSVEPRGTTESSGDETSE